MRFGSHQDEPQSTGALTGSEVFSFVVPGNSQAIRLDVGVLVDVARRLEGVFLLHASPPEEANSYRSDSQFKSLTFALGLYLPFCTFKTIIS